MRESAGSNQGQAVFPEAVANSFGFLIASGFEIGTLDENYSLGAIIRLVDPSVADQYRSATIWRLPDLQPALQRLALLVS
jgi:hypothetical protein